jgi:hypothetical protein
MSFDAIVIALFGLAGLVLIVLPYAPGRVGADYFDDAQPLASTGPNAESAPPPDQEVRS